MRNQIWIMLVLITIFAAGCASAATPTALAVVSPSAAPVLPSPTASLEQEPPTLLLSAYPAVSITEDLQIREVQDGVYIVTHAFPWEHNSMLVQMPGSELLLVDTLYTPEATRELLLWAEEKWGKQPVTAINTGFHYDNLGGNDYLIEQNIPVYGADVIVQLLEERGEALRALTLSWLKDPADERFYLAHQYLVYTAPTHTFKLEEGLELSFGDETVRVYFPGVSHTPDNVVVYFPARKILFGGCMILAGEKVGNTADADMQAWPLSLEQLKQFDVDLLIPGHGERLDPGLIEHSIDLLK